MNDHESPQQLTLFNIKARYYVLKNEDDHFWNGKEWVTAAYDAKFYLTRGRAATAKYQLRFNPIFRTKSTIIQPVF